MTLDSEGPFSGGARGWRWVQQMLPVELRGLEPLTPGLQSRCSPN